MNDSSARATTADVPAAALVRVGYIFRPHGVKGEIKVDPDATDDPHRFDTLPTVYVGRQPEAVQAFPVLSVRMQQTKRGTTVIARLEGVDDRDAAEAIAKRNVYAHEDDLDLGSDEAFVHDVTGMEVVTDDGDDVGTVTAIMPSPGHDVLVVSRPDGREALIPVVDAFILDMDLGSERLVIRPIDGLL